MSFFFFFLLFIFIQKKIIKNVFDKTTLKNLKLKSRVFLGPITHLPEKLETVAKNEVSLIMTEGCIVGDYTFSKMQTEGPFRIDSDDYTPELKKLVEVAHKHNSYILLSILH